MNRCVLLLSLLKLACCIACETSEHYFFNSISCLSYGQVRINSSVLQWWCVDMIRHEVSMKKNIFFERIIAFKQLN